DVGGRLVRGPRRAGAEGGGGGGAGVGCAGERLMEPRIQYAKTSDGVSIAYYAIGDGPPLVVMPAGLHQSIQFDWKVSNFRNAAEISARTFKYVRYDPRGSGLSDRDVNDFSLEAMAR